MCASTPSIIAMAVIVVIVVKVLVSISRDRTGSSCMTHDNQEGFCVERSACDFNTDLVVRTSTEVTPSAQLTQCYMTNNIIHVCCARNRVTDGKTSPRPTEIIPKTERQRFEPNIHASAPKSDEVIQYGIAILLESECEGNNASLSERPWMASLVYEPNTSNDTQRNCTGSLITNQYVLTAAHCIYGSPKLVSVRLGGNTNCRSNKCIDSSIQDIDIEEAIYHENYIPDLIDDIGLIRLTRPADINYYVRPICLPLTPESQTLDEGVISGWGVLQTALVQVKDNGYCQQIFRIIQMTEKLLCAQGGSDASESGDSDPCFSNNHTSLSQSWIRSQLVLFVSFEMLSDKCASTPLIITMTVIVVIVVLVLVSISRDRTGSSCMTHENQTGVCVARSACDFNTGLLAHTQAELTQCDITNNIIHVCCARNRVTDGKESASPTEIISTPERRRFEPNIYASVPKSDEEIQYGMAILLESECEGNNASLSERPWMVSLVYEPNTSNDTQRHCTGSLITKRYVLTGAHCIYGSPKLVSVRLGGNIGCTRSKCVEVSFQDIDIEEAIYHDNYIPDLIDDIGLIRLTRPADINYYVRPICLPLTPESQTLDEVNSLVWCSGDGVLQTTLVQIKDNGYCQQIFRIIQMTEKLLCAQGGSNGSESEGSGELHYLSLNYRRSKSSVQFGILPSGDRLPGLSSSFVYSSIAYYLPWLAGNIRP